MSVVRHEVHVHANECPVRPPFSFQHNRDIYGMIRGRRTGGTGTGAHTRDGQALTLCLNFEGEGGPTLLFGKEVKYNIN
jgi:hypothetical protein